MSPALPWIPPEQCAPAQLLEHLEFSNLPGKWLRDASRLALALESAPLLRRIAEHPNTPADALLNVARALPWSTLAVLLRSPGGTPLLQATCVDQLIRAWARLDPPAREEFARTAPRPLWDQIWRTAEAGVLVQFLRNPFLEGAEVIALIEVPLTRNQAEALQGSRFHAERGIIFKVLKVMAESFQDPATDLVLGLAAPWIKSLAPQERQEIAGSLAYPPMERLAQLWGSRLSPPA